MHSFKEEDAQEPTFQLVPKYTHTYGMDAGELVKHYGFTLDPWQHYEVNKTSAETILKNGEREGIKRYARVPTGAETCDFCIMLASRGFAYKSEESASHSHAHCDCRIVPEFIKGQSVEGYDPEKYYEQYRGNEARKAQQVRLSKSEYGKVTSAINDVYKAKYKGFNYGKICLGNYWYEFVIDGFNEYRFIKRGELE